MVCFRVMTLIDGHNVFFALDKDQSHHFEKDLNLWKNECLSEAEQKGKPFILIFDGSGGGHPSGSSKKVGRYGRLVYSGTITADDWIDDWIAFHKQEMVQLVSADVKLFERVKAKRVSRIDPLIWWKKPKRANIKKSEVVRNKKTFGTTSEWLEFFDEN